MTDSSPRSLAAGQLPVLEIGGTHVTAAVVDTDRWVVVPDTAVRHRLDAGASADELVHTIVAAAAGAAPGGSRWSVAIPGPFDYERGIGDFAGVGKLEALRGVDLGQLFGAALGCPSGSVAFVNDARAFGIGEWVAGAARGHSRAIAVTLGTGVGSAFLVDGAPQDHGPGVAPAGRLDLVQLRGRPLEDTISRRSIRATYAALSGSSSGRPDVRTIATRAIAGDPRATRALAEPLHALGTVLAPLGVEFGASVIVVGGAIARAWDVVEHPVRVGMDTAAPHWSEHFRLARAEQLEDAALLGAAWHAFHRVPGQR